MARFEGSTSGAAPLQIQVSATSGVVLVVVGLRASGENASGSASHPVVTRPGTVGTGTGITAEVRSVPGTATARGTFLSSFSSAPSLPSSPGSGAWNLPLRTRWEASPRDGIIVGTQGATAALLLYALGSGGHTWSGGITWEEP